MAHGQGTRRGYDTWVSFDGHGSLVDPDLNENGTYRKHTGYMTDLLNERALAFVNARHDRPWSLFLAHKAGRIPMRPGCRRHARPHAAGRNMRAPRHADLYRGAEFPRRRTLLPPDEVVKSEPAWAEAFDLKRGEKSQAVLSLLHAGTQEEIRPRAAMMASVDEGVGMLLDALERTGQLDRTFILFLGDNGQLLRRARGAERRFAYEEGIRAPFVLRYPPLAKPWKEVNELVLTPRHRADDPRSRRRHAGRPDPGPVALGAVSPGARTGWRRSFLAEYFTENALPWWSA